MQESQATPVSDLSLSVKKMPSNKNVFGFWSKVVSRAIDDSFSFSGAKLRAIIIGLAGGLIAAAGYYFIAGPEKAQDKIVWFSLTSLAMLLIVFMPLFFVFLFLAPFKLTQEVIDAAESEKNAFDDERQSLEASNALLAKELDQARSGTPDTRLKRLTLTKHIKQYQKIATGLQASDQSAYKQFYEFDGTVYDYIQSQFGVHTDFGKDGVSRVWTAKIRYDKSDFDHLLAKCEARLAVLNELLVTLS